MQTKPRVRRPSWRRIKIHRSYTVDEAARHLGIAKGTVRRWIKGGLSTVDKQKPLLILGSDLLAFGSARKAQKQRCKPDQCYCVKCRVPRAPLDGIAEYVPLTGASGNLRGICPCCGTLIHKRVAASKIPELRKSLTVSVTQVETHLLDSWKPCLNDYLEGERAANGKASSQ